MRQITTMIETMINTRNASSPAACPSGVSRILAGSGVGGPGFLAGELGSQSTRWHIMESALRLPAICPQCQHVFLSPLAFTVDMKDSLWIQNRTKCPKCGALANIADLLSDDKSMTLILAGGKEQLQQAAAFIDSQLALGVPTDQIKAEAIRTYPFLEMILQHLPSEWGAVALLNATAGLLKVMYPYFADLLNLFKDK